MPIGTPHESELFGFYLEDWAVMHVIVDQVKKNS